MLPKSNDLRPDRDRRGKIRFQNKISKQTLQKKARARRLNQQKTACNTCLEQANQNIRMKKKMHRTVCSLLNLKTSQIDYDGESLKMCCERRFYGELVVVLIDSDLFHFHVSKKADAPTDGST